ncbi:TPA: cyclic pyranopterin monophosphate synthase MoaC [Candidatus Bathyarchaeota archaeon]|nr:cyclic pyranopterin monophosphate synthase MoaC [Candidatus Bathyarchaeota archaeon]
MGEVRMVDVSGKPDVVREAVARGNIRLKPTTVVRVAERRIEKGDVLACAKLAAISAVKKAPDLLFLAHPIPITGVNVSIEIGEGSITAEVRVRSVGKTGVEMEALTGVAVCLLTIFDMCKAYEKEDGQYPKTVISDIRVVKKTKTPV